MGPIEIGGRVLQKVRQATDRSAARGLEGHPLGPPAPSWSPLPERGSATASVRDAVGVAAAAIRNGTWLLFGWREAQVPSPPAWNRDYFNGRDAPEGVEARRLDYRNLPSGADARCIWETNRWAELVTLAQNAWLNGALDDARLAQRWLLDWHDKNPVGIGVNWSSSLEAGIRLINLCWIDALIRGCDSADLTAAQDILAQRLVPVHAWWSWRHRSFGSSANNHLLGELSGIVLATRRWPSLETVACRADEAWQLLSTEILRQFAADGGNREQALHYHHFAWELAWQAACAMGIQDGSVNDRLGRAAEYFSDLVHDREPWDFGDCDDAQITPFPSARRTALTEWRGWLLGRPEGAAVRFWLGPPPVAPAPMVTTGWKRYPSSGMAVQDVNAWKVRVDGSPLGFGRLAAHGHLDATHVSVWDGARALLVDPGTGSYFGDAHIRRKLASWDWHNGPLPAHGRVKPSRAGDFLWVDHHKVPTLAIEADACVVGLASDGDVATRSIRYRAGEDAWQITDVVTGSDFWVVRWRLAPGWRISSQETPEIALTHSDKAAVTLSFLSPGALEVTVGEDVVSPHFGDLQRGPVIAVTFMTQLVSTWQRTTRRGFP